MTRKPPGQPAEQPPANPRTLPAPALLGEADSPVDGRTGDIFFSPGKGVAEGETVFLAGNGLPRRWRGHGPQPFRLFELGFGTGLNFLLTARCFLRHAPASASLDYWAVEAFPLTAGQRRPLRAGLPADLHALAERLDRLWPPATRGLHCLTVAPRIRLRLLFDDAAAGLAAVAPAVEKRRGIDAWYLDGFAPARDPALWQAAVLERAVALSAPGATAATFTAARAVRDGLTQTGFTVRRVPGFGGKRHRLTARLPAPATHPVRRPDVAIVGSGIAGVSAARALRSEGASVALLDRTAPGAAASGNPVGLITPRLALEDTAADRFFRAAWSAMLALLGDLPASAVPRRGALLPMVGEARARRAERLIASGALPPEDLRLLDRDAAGAAAGTDPGGPCLYIEDAPVIAPARLIRLLTADLPWQVGPVAALARRGDAWDLADRRGGTLLSAETVVLAGGYESLAPTDAFPLDARLGQLTLVAATPASAGLRVALSGDGYVTPAIDGVHAVGATFDRPDRHGLRPQARDDARNLAQLAHALPGLAARLGGRAAKIVGHRRAIRATTPDRLPLVGAVPDPQAFAERHRRAARGGGPHDFDDPAGLMPGLFTLSGLGARGFLTAPLAGDILAARIAGSMLPAPSAVVRALHPARFLWRRLQRGG